jgi:hypothetical protein
MPHTSTQGYPGEVGRDQPVRRLWRADLTGDGRLLMRVGRCARPCWREVELLCRPHPRSCFAAVVSRSIASSPGLSDCRLRFSLAFGSGICGLCHMA